MTIAPTAIAKAVYVAVWLTALTLAIGLALVAGVLRVSSPTGSVRAAVPPNQFDFDSGRAGVAACAVSAHGGPPSRPLAGARAPGHHAPTDTAAHTMAG